MMMKPLRFLASALALCLVDAYLVTPPGTPAPGAASACSAWVQASYGLTCDIIHRFYGMTAAEFEEWNPSVSQLGDGCTLITGLYYCVQVNYITQSPTWTAPTTTTRSTTSSAGNGITTPTPTQTGMVSSCNKFYLVVSGDSCYDIAAAQGISLDNFYAWNPAVGSSCGGLWPDYYVCVGVISGGTTTTTLTTTTSTTSTGTTTTAGNGVTTPTPIQTGMVTSCNKFYLVVSGDGCYDIAAAAGVALSDFYAWNPAVGSSCAGLWPNYYVCVGVLGGAGTTTTKTTTTTTTSGNGVATPTPTQSGMVSNCKKFYLVVSGDGCYDIAAAAGIALNDFYAWNPAVGNTCAGLWPNYYVCVGI
ncbi:hypothetical protein ALT_6305 [Aspergillus lentulus]|uniref:LysM domain-containing protein n=1 Tax=Aspergillus lentulus TaxID=293939 RepID=A0AAN4PN35_ASPLE|nr:hypothetical protein ALT_6305 [Aspergillus lentulus]